MLNSENKDSWSGKDKFISKSTFEVEGIASFEIFKNLAIDYEVTGLLYHIKEKYVKSMFHPRIMDNEHMKGEYVVFCENVKREGYTIGVDTKLQIGHGFYTINKTVADALRRLRDERRQTIKVDDLDPNGIKHLI